MHVVGERQPFIPPEDLLVRIARVLRAERWVADQTLEHDRAQRPPITFVPVTFLHEYLGSNVIWSTDSGIGLVG